MCYFSNNYQAFLGILEDIFVVKEWKRVLNFKLGETNLKMKWSAWHERGTKKKSESPTGFEALTAQTPGGRSIHLS